MCFSPQNPKNTNNNMHVVKIYNCSYCKKTHQVILPKDIADGKDRYPFPYVFLHSSEGDLKVLLTTLYLDAQLAVRGVEVIQIENSDIFSEELTRKITNKLMDQVMSLEEENFQLRELLQDIDINELKDSLDEEDEIAIIEVTDIPPPLPERKVKGIRVYLLSLIGSERREDVLIELNEKISEVKKAVGKLYGFNVAKFHLSFDGIIMKENTTVSDYQIAHGDEIVLIPALK